jgi:hypothetical protein
MWPISTRVNEPETGDDRCGLNRASEMMDDAEKRGQLIRHLQDALALADEVQKWADGIF